MYNDYVGNGIGGFMAFKKFSELESMYGKKMANLIKNLRKPYMKKLPMDVTETTRKPKFYLDNGDMLRAFAFDLETFEVVQEAYCGSGDTVMMHLKQQFGEGEIPNDSKLGIIFVHSYASSSNHPWSVTVVRPERKEVEQSDEELLNNFNWVGSRHHY
jgi:hypothetical protein